MNGMGAVTPKVGDAVRIAPGESWDWSRPIMPQDTLGTVDLVGNDGESDGCRIVFDSGCGTTFTSFSEFTATGETVVRTRFAGWKDGMPGADRAEYEDVTVPLWHWHPRN